MGETHNIDAQNLSASMSSIFRYKTLEMGIGWIWGKGGCGKGQFQNWPSKNNTVFGIKNSAITDPR